MPWRKMRHHLHTAIRRGVCGEDDGNLSAMGSLWLVHRHRAADKQGSGDDWTGGGGLRADADR